MERCRLNLRIVDEGCPGNEQHQHLESNKDSYRGMFCTRSQLTFFPKTTSLAAEGTYCITNSVKARITKDLALEFELRELRFAGKFEDEGRRPLPINLHLIMLPSPSLHGALGKFMSRPCQGLTLR